MIDIISPLATGLFLWFKADSITGVPSGTPVAKWMDSSSSKFEATSSDPRFQPTFQMNSLNGKPALRFDGGQKLSTLPIQLFHNGSDSLTLFIVFQTNTIDRPSCLINKSSGGKAADFELAIDSGSQASGNMGMGQIDGNAVTSKANVISPFSFYILALSLASDGKTPENVFMQINSTPQEVLKNGKGWLDSGFYPTNLSSFDIGAKRNKKTNGDAEEFFSGDIAEILAFSHKLSQPDLSKVGCYLQRKYNIAEALPWCFPKTGDR